MKIHSRNFALVPIVFILAFLTVMAHVLFLVAFPIAGVTDSLLVLCGAAGLAIGMALAFSHEAKPER